jgi:penicillin G amidase
VHPSTTRGAALKRTLQILVGLIVLLAAAAGGGYLWLRTSLPVTSGTIVLKGLSAPVRIVRDVHGIPTIAAANERDAAFALGFLHAQDRLYQMDLTRHIGAGRLSEWFGARTVDFDRGLRTLGLYRAAQAQQALLPPEEAAVLDAYAAGVNAYIDGRRGALPPEYYVLRTAPERWRPADSLVWGKLMDIQLTGNYRGELLRAEMLKRISAETMAFLFPPYPAAAPTTLSTSSASLERILAALPAPTLAYASNNWVVDGEHSASGKPLLANDPHLDYGAPSIWYLAKIVTPAATLAGVTSPGTPFVVIGHNDRIAWGFTTTTGDVSDVFVEKLDPADPARYLTPQGPMPFATRQEEIRVRGASPLTLTLRSTRHGVVLSDLGDARPDAGEVLALQTTWLGGEDRTPQALWEMTHARDWTEFRAALVNWTAPQQNIVYADVDGAIGFIAPAHIPIRRKGDGWLPVPGWSGEYDWTGFIPFDALPSALNPSSGHFVSANNKIIPAGYRYFISRDWDLPNRAERIETLLDGTPKQTPASTAAIQLDTLSLNAERLLPLLLATRPRSARAAEALRRLGGWAGAMDRRRPEPLIFAEWLRALTRTLLEPRLGAIFRQYWGLSSEHPDFSTDAVRRILEGHRDWCGGTPDAGACDAALAQSLETALDALSQRYGEAMDQWRWGAAHPATFDSRLWDAVPVVSGLIDLAVPADGGNDTVDAGAYVVRDGAAPFTDRHGPTLRMVVDMANPAAARFMISPGQSGNPLSPHYGDLLLPWRNGQSLAFTDDASGGTLTLAPN